MPEQRTDICDCGAQRTELIVVPGRFYCPACGIAGEHRDPAEPTHAPEQPRLFDAPQTTRGQLVL